MQLMRCWAEQLVYMFPQVPTNVNHSVIQVLQILARFRIPCLDGAETLTALSILRQALRQSEGGLKGANSRAITESWAVHKTTLHTLS